MATYSQAQLLAMGAQPAGSTAAFPKKKFTLEELLAQGATPATVTPMSSGGATHPMVEPPAGPQQLRFGAPSIPANIGQEAANALLPEQFSSQIAARLNPGSEAWGPEEGNYGILRDGEKLYMNAPGVSGQDAVNLVTGAGVAATGSGLLGQVPRLGPALKGATMAHPFLMSGAGAGAFSLAQQAAGHFLTGEPVDEAAIARDMAAGTILPAALRPMLGIFRRGMAQIDNWMTPDGQLSTRAKQALEAAGIKYQHLKPEEIEKINSAAMRGTSYVDEALGRKAALSMDDIEATRGMITQRPADVARENLGPDSAQWSTAGQQLVGKESQLAPQQSAAAFSKRLTSSHEAAQTQANAGMNAARRASENVDVPTSLNEQVGINVRAALTKDFDEADVNTMMANFPQPTPGEPTGILDQFGKPIMKPDIPATYREMYEWRKKIDDPSGKAKKAFDREMQDAIDNQLAGNLGPDAIVAWQKGLKGYEDYANVWRGKDILQKLVKKDAQGYKLKSDPESAWNLLFDAADTGFLTKDGTRTAMRKIVDIFGINSPEVQSMRDTLERRMLKLDTLLEPTDRAGFTNIKGKDIVQHWEKVKTKWGTELNEIYPPEVLERMDNFVVKARWLDQSTGSAKPAEETGGATAILNAGLRRLAEATFRFQRAGYRQIGEAVKGRQRETAEAALGGPIKRQVDWFPGSGAAFAEADEIMWDEVYDEALDDVGLSGRVKELIPDWYKNAR